MSLAAKLVVASLEVKVTVKVLSLVVAPSATALEPLVAVMVIVGPAVSGAGFRSKIRTWPALFAVPSLRIALIATLSPDADKETAKPLLSSAASPSISL